MLKAKVGTKKKTKKAKWYFQSKIRNIRFRFKLFRFPKQIYNSHRYIWDLSVKKNQMLEVTYEPW